MLFLKKDRTCLTCCLKAVDLVETQLWLVCSAMWEFATAYKHFVFSESNFFFLFFFFCVSFDSFQR